MERLLVVALGGAIGTVLRYAVTVGAIQALGTGFPYGTLVVNLIGAFIIGLVQALAADTTLVPESTRLFLTTGMLGGFTTYSAFSYETVRLIELHAWAQASVYVLGTTFVCLLLCFLGLGVGRGLLFAIRG